MLQLCLNLSGKILTLPSDIVHMLPALAGSLMHATLVCQQQDIAECPMRKHSVV